jgi:hypothetical protein
VFTSGVNENHERPEGGLLSGQDLKLVILLSSPFFLTSIILFLCSRISSFVFFLPLSLSVSSFFFSRYLCHQSADLFK